MIENTQARETDCILTVSVAERVHNTRTRTAPVMTSHGCPSRHPRGWGATGAVWAVANPSAAPISWGGLLSRRAVTLQLQHLEFSGEDRLQIFLHELF